MEIDFPAPPCLTQPAKHTGHGEEVGGCVVRMAAGRRRVNEKSVWPRLAWSRRVPLITHAKCFRQSTDHGHLFHREVVHHSHWIGPRHRGSLPHVIVDEPRHWGRLIVRSPAKPK